MCNGEINHEKLIENLPKPFIHKEDVTELKKVNCWHLQFLKSIYVLFYDSTVWNYCYITISQLVCRNLPHTTAWKISIFFSFAYAPYTSVTKALFDLSNASPFHFKPADTHLPFFSPYPWQIIQSFRFLVKGHPRASLLSHFKRTG